MKNRLMPEEGTALTVGPTLTPTGLVGTAHAEKDIPVRPSCTAATLLDTTSLDPEKNVRLLNVQLGEVMPHSGKGLIALQAVVLFSLHIDKFSSQCVES